MNLAAVPELAGRSRLQRFLDLTLVRMIVAIFATALAGGLATAFVGEAAGGRFHEGWPEACGALVSLVAYALYVRLIERRRVGELAGGTAMVGAVMGVLGLAGVYRFGGVDASQATPAALATGFAQMAFVAVLEELLTRAIVFRMLERVLGSWAALALSSLLFGLGHLPNNPNANALSFAIVVAAGAFFCAAYMATGRLWLCIGLHAGWNFTLGHVFSIAVSGHPRTPGLLVGTLDGPAWLTGGAYGLEASLLTLLALSAVGSGLLGRAASRGHPIAWKARA